MSVSVSDLRVEEEEEGWQGVDGVVRGEGNHVRYALEGLRTRGRAGQGPVGNEDEDVDFGVCGDVVDAVDDDGLVDVPGGLKVAEGGLKGLPAPLGGLGEIAVQILCDALRTGPTSPVAQTQPCRTAYKIDQVRKYLAGGMRRREDAAGRAGRGECAAEGRFWPFSAPYSDGQNGAPFHASAR